MKIKIIKSPSFSPSQGYEYLPPLSMACIYSFLKNKGFDIVQQDLANIAPNNKNAKRQAEKIRKSYKSLFIDNERLLAYLKGANDRGFDKVVNKFINRKTFEGIDVLLISVYAVDFYSSVTALLLARYFKGMEPDKLVIIGGEWLQRSLIYDNFELYNSTGVIDYYIMGYGEESLFKLLQRIQGEKINLRDIPGLCYREGDRAYMPSQFPSQILTVPNFDDLNLESYRWNQSSFFRRISKRLPNAGVLMLPVRMISGCPNRCAFCTSCNFKSIKYIEPEKAAQNLDMLYRRYNTPYFFFMDDEVTVSENFVDTFCEKIIRMGLKICWTACATVKQISNPDTLKKMRKAGACRLIFGLETASPRMLHFINKNIELEHVSKVLRWSNEAGIWTGLEIIVGLPHENEEDIRLTIDFIHKNRQYLDEVWLNRFFLALGSKIFDTPLAFGITNISDYDRLPKILERDLECYRFSFDEVGGLAWREKLLQGEKAYGAVLRVIEEYNLDPRYDIRDEMSALFYLYTFLSDKNQIKEYLKLYRNR